jgi:hypothetical protein
VNGIKVAIWGPNLRTTGEAMHVHKPGCKDTTRGIYRFAEPPWVIEVGSIRDIVEDIYPPDDFGYDANTEWSDYFTDIKVFPCVTELPDEAGEA